MKRLIVLLGGLVALGAGTTQAQIVIVLNGSSKAQPGLVVLAGKGIDSVRAIVQRDLINSDRFTVAQMTDSAATLNAAFDPATAKDVAGLNWVVELQPAPGGVSVKLWDAATGVVRQQATRSLDLSGVGDTRLAVHRVSDDVVNWTGGIGIAATRIAFKMKNGTEDAIWRIDSDGANPVRVSRGGGAQYTMTPAWSPDGSMIAYSEHKDSRWTLYLQKLATGSRTAVTTKDPGDAYGANFSPDSHSLVFTFLPAVGSGAIIETVSISPGICCAHELTHDRRNADNSSASYSPDGRHIAYISNRTGTPQIWVMDADGLSGEQLVPPDFNDRGRPLDTYSPAWSPDNTRILFTRDTPGGGRQLYRWTVGSANSVTLTSTGRNEDATWALDSRHIVFKSDRSGREQLWIYDTESTSLRQLNTPGGAQFPSWSPVFGNNP